MITYQDLLAIGDDETKRMDFVRKAINEHKASDDYRFAQTADLYYKKMNVTISEFQRLLYTVSGKAVPDLWSPNFKMASGFFKRIVTQENLYLLGNGITWKNEDTADRLGNKKYSIDKQTKELGKNALIMKVAFGFFNLDHVDVFTLLEFVPLYDEENGSLSAGIRFWQLDDTKPLRATLYEIDGYTEYIWRAGQNAEVYREKTPYKLNVKTSEIDGKIIYGGENYPSFPIVPFWGNPEHQSELVGIREQIDCYDLIKSGFANTVDEASIVYWTITNAGGMDDVDLAQFVQRMKTVHAVTLEDQEQAQSHSQDVPYASREALLERLSKDLYKDAMALDTEHVSGSLTATEIKTAYELLNSKVDDFEYCAIDFLDNILEIAGIDDEPTFSRSKVVNVTEEIQTITQSAMYLPAEYVTTKILTLLGDGDKADDILKAMNEEDYERFNAEEEPEQTEETEKDVNADELGTEDNQRLS